jgi:outer membrane murein-binding lipoprotein Lpp
MKSIIRVAAVVVAFTTAGCISKADVTQVSAAAPAEVTGMFSEMHAAIPASKNNSNVFDYN